MLTNPVLKIMMNRKSIRKYTGEYPSDEMVETVVRAGQQAPFAYQMCSLLLSREKNKHPFRAPLLFTILVDSHRIEKIMERLNWKLVTNDLSLLLMGIQDAALMAENMVIAGESMGLGSCFIGDAPYRAEQIVKKYKLPERVLPLVQLTMGFPDENPPLRPRYPLEFSLFENEYPVFSDEILDKSIHQMDHGYMAQDYYSNNKLMIPLETKRKETFTFKNYGWTEHISRKLGQWHSSSKKILTQLIKCGFNL